MGCNISQAHNVTIARLCRATLLILICMMLPACHESASDVLSASAQHTCQPLCAHLDNCNKLHFIAGATSISDCEDLCKEAVNWVDLDIPECTTVNYTLASCISELTNCMEIDDYFNGYPGDDQYPCEAAEFEYTNCEQTYSNGFFVVPMTREEHENIFLLKPVRHNQLGDALH